MCVLALSAAAASPLVCPDTFWSSLARASMSFTQSAWSQVSTSWERAMMVLFKTRLLYYSLTEKKRNLFITFS